MDDKTWAKIEAKREQAAYFRGLEKAAHRAATRRPKATRTRAPRAKPEPREWGLTWSCPIGPKPRPPKRPSQRKPRDEWKPRSGRPVTRPDNCLGCERPFRPRRAKVADHPGTVYHAARGLCITCERHSERKP